MTPLRRNSSRAATVGLYATYAAALILGLVIFDSDPDSSGLALIVWALASFAFGFASGARYGLLVPVPIGLLAALPFGAASDGAGEAVPVLVFAGAAMPVAVLGVLGGVALRLRQDKPRD